MIRPEDDKFHQRSDDPFWNESAWLSFMVPERELTGFVYVYHRPNMGYSVGGVVIWDPSGSESHNCLHYDWGTVYPLAEGADMFDFSLPNGLAATCVEPIKTIHLSYRGESWYEARGCELDLTYTGFMPPHDTGLPSFGEWGSGGHYEQPGRMKGVIRLNGDQLDIDCWSLRDRSWGPRRLVHNPRGHFTWAIASEQSAFAVIGASRVSPEDDPGIGTSESIVAGWYLKDGVYGDVSSGVCRVVERGDDGRPLRMVVEASDHLGRDLFAEGSMINTINFTGFPFLLVWWGQFEWEFDGTTALGEEQDAWPVQQSRRFIRSLAEVPTATR